MKVSNSTIDNISDEKLEEILKVLTLLAKRKKPNVSWWTNHDSKSGAVTCNICDQFICNFDNTTNIVFNHMFNHLKEYNLLVML